MRITDKGRFAIISIVYLASLKEKKPVRIKEIAEINQISDAYLEQIFSKLRKSNIVRAVKGPGGGYLLNNKIEQIKLSDILNAVEEETLLTRCKKIEGGCHTYNKICLTHNLWNNVSNYLIDYFSSISVKDVLDNNTERNINKYVSE